MHVFDLGLNQRSQSIMNTFFVKGSSNKNIHKNDRKSSSQWVSRSHLFSKASSSPPKDDKMTPVAPADGNETAEISEDAVADPANTPKKFDGDIIKKKGGGKRALPKTKTTKEPKEKRKKQSINPIAVTATPKEEEDSDSGSDEDELFAVPSIPSQKDIRQALADSIRQTSTTVAKTSKDRSLDVTENKVTEEVVNTSKCKSKDPPSTSTLIPAATSASDDVVKKSKKKRIPILSTVPLGASAVDPNTLIAENPKSIKSKNEHWKDYPMNESIKKTDTAALEPLKKSSVKSVTTAATDTATNKTSIPAPANPPPLPPKDQIKIEQYSSLCRNLLQQAENLPLPPSTSPSNDTNNQSDKLSLREHLAQTIEGRSDDLDTLVQKLTQYDKYTNMTVDDIKREVQLIAEYKPHFGANANKYRVQSCSSKDFSVYKWHVATLEYFPNSARTAVKGFRAKLKKIASYFKACNAVLGILYHPEKPKYVNKLNEAEGKILKHERVMEKDRADADRRKERENEKNRKKEEREQLRLKRLKEKEIEDQLKREQKERERLQREKELNDLEQRKQAELLKEKNRFKSFFVVKSDKSSSLKDNDQSESSPSSSSSKQGVREGFNSDNFWNALNSGLERTLQSHLDCWSSSSKRCRPSRLHPFLKTIPAIFETIHGPKTMNVRSKYKFLQFHTDYRPAYYGTWSKQSSTISPRSPFARDVDQLDYDYDSEAEWEEPSGEEGADDCCIDDEDEELFEEADDEGGVRKRVDTRELDYSDGWLMQDDVSHNLDKESRQGKHNTSLLVVQPNAGKPILVEAESSPSVAGSDVDIIHSCSYVASPFVDICLEPFEYTPLACKKNLPAAITPVKKKDLEEKEDLLNFVKFIHGSTLSSRDKVIETFLLKHPGVFKSRAAAARAVDRIANKRRTKGGGFLWEVHQEVLKEHNIEVIKTINEDGESCADKVLGNEETRYSHSTSSVPTSILKKRSSCSPPLAKSKAVKFSLSPSMTTAVDTPAPVSVKKQRVTDDRADISSPRKEGCDTSVASIKQNVSVSKVTLLNFFKSKK